MTRIKRVLFTGGAAASVKLLSVLTNLYTVPLTINYLGTERYGLWMAISSIMTLLAFADFGLGNSLVNSISRADSKKDLNHAQESISSIFFTLCIISTLMFSVLAISHNTLKWSDILNLKSEIAKNEANTTFLVLFILLIVNLPLGIVQRIQSGYQQGYKSHFWSLLGIVISFISLLVAIYLKAGLPLLVLAFSSGQLISTLFNALYLFFYSNPELKPRISLFNKRLSQKMLKEGLIFFLLIFFTLLTNASDNIIISKFIGPDSVSKYEVVRKLFLMAMMTNFIIEPLWPAFGEAMESGDYKWAKKTFSKTLILSLLAGILFCIPLILFGEKIIITWLGKDFVPSIVMLLGFSSYILVMNYNGVMSVLINSSTLFKKQLIPYAIAAGLSIFFKIMFSIYFGLNAVIWGTVLAWLLAYLIPAYRIAKEILNTRTAN